MKKLLKDFLFTLSHPSYWCMNYPYSKIWDEKFCEALAKHKFTDIDHHEAFLGPYKLWIANYPYASFVFNGHRPSRRTLKAAGDKLIKDAIEGLEKKS